ncbi:MAG: DNA primase [Gammaproteobacteria bacterium]|nr:DNA primase [Gammaproteobacteria bacterium]
MADYSLVIEAIRARSDLVTLIGSSVSLKKAGKSYLGLCPFHQEKTPSFHVYVDRQRFHCYGCQKDGDIFDYVKEYQRMSFPQAVEYLADYYHLNDLIKDDKESHEDRKIPQLLDILARVADFFHAQLLLLPRNHLAWQMLAARNVSDFFVKKYKIGWSEGFSSLAERFPKEHDLLIEAGLVVAGARKQPCNRFVDRLMFPIYSNGMNVIGFGGRLVKEDRTQQYPKYINSPETLVFKKSQILYGLSQSLEHSKFKSFLIVEGYFDVLQLALHGFECGVAPMGTAFGEEHLKKLLSYRRELIFCFDGDRAGQDAAFKACCLLLPFYTHKLHVSFVTLPADHDPDSFLLTYGRQSFVNLCQKRVKIGEYLFQKLIQRYPVESVDNIVVFVSEAKKLIRTIEDPDARTTLLKVLDSYLPKKNHRAAYAPSIAMPALRAISPLEWFATLCAAKPALWDGLTEGERVALKMLSASGPLGRLFESFANKSIENDSEWQQLKQKHRSLLALLPEEGIEHEWREQLQLLRIRVNKD